MKPAVFAPIHLAETQISSSFEENTLRSAETKRDRKIFLTSLLFTASLVACAVTSLPRFLSLPALEASQWFTVPEAQPHTKTLITVTPAAGVETVNLTLSLSSASSVRVAEVSIKPDAPLSGSDRSGSDRYTVQVLLK